MLPAARASILFALRGRTTMDGLTHMMPSPPSPSLLFAAVEESFARMHWAGRRVPGREVMEADFEAHHTRIRVHVQAFPELNAISVGTTLGHQVPDSRAGLVSEVLMRTNLELTIGAFELDYDTGRVLFRATNIFPPGGSVHQITASLVHSALAETDRLTPFLTLLLRMDPGELGRLNLKLFLQREDLLPPVPESADSSPP
jgi:hypothetical protein